MTWLHGTEERMYHIADEHIGLHAREQLVTWHSSMSKETLSTA